LVVFVLEGVAFFLLLPWLNPAVSWAEALSLSVGLLTGSDPYQLTRWLRPSDVPDAIGAPGAAWLFAWVLHTQSWLVIPALFAIVLSETAELTELEHRRLGETRRLTNRLINEITEEAISPAPKDEASTNIVIAELLKRMCEVVASRVPVEDKGATLLVLSGPEENAHFRVFAKHNHLEGVGDRVARYLTRDMSLAGQAL
jgi:hypothetical protein